MEQGVAAYFSPSGAADFQTHTASMAGKDSSQYRVLSLVHSNEAVD